MQACPHTHTHTHRHARSTTHVHVPVHHGIRLRVYTHMHDTRQHNTTQHNSHTNTHTHTAPQMYTGRTCMDRCTYLLATAPGRGRAGEMHLYMTTHMYIPARHSTRAGPCWGDGLIYEYTHETQNIKLHVSRKGAHGSWCSAGPSL